VKISQQPYRLFLFAGLFFLMASFLVSEKLTMDVHLHDTYFVLTYSVVFLCFAFLAIVIWAFYQLTNRLRYSKKLTWAHVMLTIAAVLMFIGVIFWSNDSTAPKQYFDISSFELFHWYRGSILCGAIAVFIFVVGQLLWLVNIIRGTMKRAASANMIN
jgi:drug/metabolite transporter (DMT)-like permease